jgi:hypothetical protein
MAIGSFYRLRQRRAGPGLLLYFFFFYFLFFLRRLIIIAFQKKFRFKKLIFLEKNCLDRKRLDLQMVKFGKCSVSHGVQI